LEKAFAKSVSKQEEEEGESLLEQKMAVSVALEQGSECMSI
jgi:hypothetical protein